MFVFGLKLYKNFLKTIKDLLTNHGDIPNSCVCAVCLYNFNTVESFMRLECYHYFHTPCLIKHVEFMKSEIQKEREEAERNKLFWKPRYVSYLY